MSLPLASEAQPGLLRAPRFTRHGLPGLGLLLSALALLALVRREQALEEWRAMLAAGQPDLLLAGLGAYFVVCFALDGHPGRDLPTVLAGLLGGLILESWGTHSGLWHYYTHERPPLWILPAWGASAVAVERTQKLGAWLLPPRLRTLVLADERGTPSSRVLYRCAAAASFFFFAWWARSALGHPASWAVALLLLLSLRSRSHPLYGLSLLAAGSLLGYFLELWGTSRHCWNYHDARVPSPFPVLGHGLAAISFWRLKQRLRSFFRE